MRNATRNATASNTEYNKNDNEPERSTHRYFQKKSSGNNAGGAHEAHCCGIARPFRTAGSFGARACVLPPGIRCSNTLDWTLRQRGVARQSKEAIGGAIAD
ncbi:hypothetical protein LFL96_32345 [Paraburkholderia sp. D15]|uniref:hypothetical protein n=1 Tax=Paraburkholderia sp. D15 TaxID=2880218 RepID=UPI002479A346|nr:hypothetical protein [Paraburkholderia sp. D15]WGS52865.1 hypothetical protein LFL96_32345 [Paraburkholderia sp. D15]